MKNKFEEDGWQPTLDLIKKLRPREIPSPGELQITNSSDGPLLQILGRRTAETIFHVNKMGVVTKKEVLMEQYQPTQQERNEDARRQMAVQILDRMSQMTQRARLEMGFIHSIGSGPFPYRTYHG